MCQPMCVSKASDGEQDGHIGLTGLLGDYDTVVGEDASIGDAAGIDDAAGISVDGPSKADEKAEESVPAPWTQEDRPKDQVLND